MKMQYSPEPGGRRRPRVAGSADAAAPTKAAAVNRALSIVGTSPVAMRRAGGDAFAARDVIVDADGTEHVRSIAPSVACR